MKATTWYEVDCFSNEGNTLEKRSWHTQKREAITQAKKAATGYDYVAVNFMKGELDTEKSLFDGEDWGLVASFTKGKRTA